MRDFARSNSDFEMLLVETPDNGRGPGDNSRMGVLCNALGVDPKNPRRECIGVDAPDVHERISRTQDEARKAFMNLALTVKHYSEQIGMKNPRLDISQYAK